MSFYFGWLLLFSSKPIVIVHSIVSDDHRYNILTAAGPRGIAVRDGSPIRKRSEPLSNNNRVDNSSPPATLYEDGDNRHNDDDNHYHDAGFENRDTPTLIRGVLIGERKEDTTALKVGEITRESLRVTVKLQNPFSRLPILDERDDPCASDSMLGLLGIV
ncbi:hypothetical protein BGAL_0534g00020 [Botrytis galanthina]|uniref:Uncharacterized protein n=1 Tax=Botrytis galanthina TaxID=278940 RepID=A0A4S8QJE9_9HELO|nr:hypothetical protein BGAL_0534g00020 [Botrytis galanthina]